MPLTIPVQQEVARKTSMPLFPENLAFYHLSMLTQMIIISITVGKNHLEEMEQPSQSTRVRNAVLGCHLKNHRMITVHFQGKPFNITVIQDYEPTNNAEEAEAEGYMKTYKTFKN